MPSEVTRLTEAWADLVSTISFNNLPREEIGQTIDYIIDHVGDVISGCDSPTGQMFIKLAKEEGGNPEATILGAGIRASGTMAALVNAKLGNIHDNDDVFINRIHIGTIPLCAALAVAEKTRASGKDLILATVLGYEMCARCALATPLVEVTQQGEVRFPTVLGYSYNTFGALVAAAKVLGLNKAQIENGLSIAAYFAPLPLAGLWRRREPENMLKYCDLGWLTHAGVTAALLARVDFKASTAILDDEYFWQSCGVSNLHYNTFLEGLGKSWHIMQAAIKPYPCCRNIHSSIDMLTRIMNENALHPDDIESVAIRLSPLTLNPEYIWCKVSKWDTVEPKDDISSQFSFSYNLACAVYGIPAGPEWHGDAMLRDPRLIEFSKKVSLEGDPQIGQSMLAYKGAPGAIRRKYPVTIEVRAKGKVFADSSDYALGDSWVPEYRLSSEEIDKKFRVNVSKALSDSQTEQVLEQLRRLDRIDDINEITKHLA